MATNLPSCFSIEFLEQLLKFLVEICKVSEKLRLLNHRRADFWLPNFGFKRSLLTLLKLRQNYFLSVCFSFRQRLIMVAHADFDIVYESNNYIVNT